MEKPVAAYPEQPVLRWEADVLSVDEVRTAADLDPLVADCGVLGPQPVISAAVKRRRRDPNP